jgi:tRNA-Thr(GGU) m(6)t(6)A37 methyltransferase TsaA
MAMKDSDVRPGEIRATIDPETIAADAGVVFIGRVRSPWRERRECPRNISAARERSQPADLEIDAPWRPGLAGLASGDRLIVLYWMNHARRDLIVQAPRHRPDPAGVFALRSPARPNPIALATVKVLAIDHAEGRITIDAIDCLDGTPLVDIKPWREAMDVPAGAA